jgi:hypothetical protein
MNQQWTDITISRCLMQDAGSRWGEGETWCGDRCVAATTNNNRSIDITTLSHVNIKLYRHLSKDIKALNNFGEILQYKEKFVAVKRLSLDIVFKNFVNICILKDP